MNFYPRYIGDYQRDTSRLSMVEHGAYTLLLDDYYATERPLPPDLPALYHICRAQTDEERRAVDRVCALFFPIGDDGMRHHQRVDEEIVKANKRITKAKNNAKTRWHGKGRSNARTDARVDATTDALHPHPHKGITTSDTAPARSGAGGPVAVGGVVGRILPEAEGF